MSRIGRYCHWKASQALLVIRIGHYSAPFSAVDNLMMKVWVFDDRVTASVSSSVSAAFSSAFWALSGN